MNIENCNGIARDDETTKTCVMCVSVNGCYFVNEEERKPNHPQHPNCRCREIAKSAPHTEEIKVSFEMEKISKYFFTDPSKANIPKYMGFLIEDAKEVYDEITKQGKEQYANGNYIYGHHNLYGYVIKIPILLRGKKLKSNEYFKFYTGWAIYPNKKIKFNTPFAGWID